MPRFYITSENSEDRFGSADNLQEAIRIAREVVREEKVGDPICIEKDGKNIWQFVRTASGKVTEEALAG